nr:cytochrome c maturation protein CcmE [Anaerolineaceae bacterium]
MEQNSAAKTGQGRMKFIIGGILILAAIIYLIVSSTSANAQYFLTVDELIKQKTEMMDRDIRISGVVIGDTIQNDLENQTISFTIAHIPGDNKEIEA